MTNASPTSDVRFIAIEGRLATLEAQVGFATSRTDKAEGRVESLSERITRIEERVSALPTKDWLVKIILGTLAVITAITAFQSKIQQLLGSASLH